jgi:redox-sensitive bicupin YhaK (pirin superfamily)
MIVVRKVEERQRQRASRRLKLRAAVGEEVTLGLFDLWLPPGQRIELDVELGCELLTYVVTGTLAHARGTHTRAVLGPSELQCAALGLEDNIAHTQTNPSLSEASHVVQLLVHDPRRTLELRQEQRRLSFAQRRGVLCVVAGRDASPGVLPIQNEITVYSSVLDPGQHMVHAFAAAHSGIMHVVSGELSVAGYVLGPGDTVHALAERSLAFTAREHAEVLLGDVHGLTSF